MLQVRIIDLEKQLAKAYEKLALKVECNHKIKVLGEFSDLLKLANKLNE
jgi:hypothetical protein